MAHENPSRPPSPPFMANAILNFHFDYLTTSLSSCALWSANRPESRDPHKIVKNVEWLEEFSETENFRSSRPWLGWQICKLIRICRFWRIDQYFERLEGLIRIALHQIGCKVHIGWEICDGLPKSLLVRKWILSSPLNFFSFLGYVRISLLVFRVEKVDDFAFSEFIPSIHILLALVRSFPSTEI